MAAMVGGKVLTPEASRLYRVRQTVCKMLDNRGYVVPPEDMSMTIDHFMETFCGPDGIPARSAAGLSVQLESDLSQRICVHFANGDIGTKDAPPVISMLNDLGASRCVIVYHGKFSAIARQQFLSTSPTYTFEFFRDEELLVDITEHELVPEHIVLLDAEKRALLERYKLRESQLPRILATDPIARYYGMAKGDVVKIIRASETAGRYVTYRIVM